MATATPTTSRTKSPAPISKIIDMKASEGVGGAMFDPLPRGERFDYLGGWLADPCRGALVWYSTLLL